MCFHSVSSRSRHLPTQREPAFHGSAAMWTLSIVAAITVIVAAGPASAKGTVWDVVFEDDAQSTGTVGVTIHAKRPGGQVDDYLFNVNVEELPTSNEWKASELRDQVDGSSYFRATVDQDDDGRVHCQIQDNCSTYDTIDGIDITENGTGEGVHTVSDPPGPEDPVILTRIELDVTGTGTGGWFKLGIAYPDSPRVEISTAGLAGAAIETSLASAFNQAYGTFEAVLEGGVLIIDNVPCPWGASAGTTDTALSYLFRVSVPHAHDPAAVEDAEPGDARPALHLSAPTPFRPSTDITFDLPWAAPVSLTIHDIAGRVVRTLVQGEVLPAGWGGELWDGRNDTGRDVAGGRYFVRLAACGTTQTCGLLFVR